MTHLSVSLAAVTVMLALSACSGGAPAPRVVDLTLVAAPTLNPDKSGKPKPLHVRVLRLTATEALARADFFTLDGDPAKALGRELVGFDEVVMAPGATGQLQQTFEPTARYIGVVGAYSAIDRAAWRAWRLVPDGKVTPLRAELGSGGLTLTGEEP
jgi:type VI secretion system protein VasD